MNCKYKSCMTKKKAFTLIELLIVIAIIGILFIVLVSKVDFATDKAKASGVQTDFRSFQVAFEMVSKENAGFNTFGWDTGDNAGAAPAGYTYLNADKDKGDRIRNSYDEGDTNLNGIYDKAGENGATVDEVWTGRKVYTENWTGCYTLINPGDSSDISAIFDLQTAINKNLDPKLHINIADDGTITMANGLKDPWSTQYHGRYITNASADAAAKWNTDASMAGSTGDNMDRGAILMYSNGANQKFGTKVKIVSGVVTATVSQIDADHPDNNKYGADDYVLAVVYSYTNGYGEVASTTWGFSNNQVFLTGNGGNVSNDVTPGGNGGTLQLPAENPSGDLQDYFDAGNWSSIKVLANARLTKDDYKNKYGIEPGDTIVYNGTTYVLVDLGIDNNGDGVIDNEEQKGYDGFVFMYHTGIFASMNSSATNAGGYAYSEMVNYIQTEIYNKLPNDGANGLKANIKQVSITSGCGKQTIDGVDDNGKSTYTIDAYMFIASSREMGMYSSAYQLFKEGIQFDFFPENSVTLLSNFISIININSSFWTRSAAVANDKTFTAITRFGSVTVPDADDTNYIVPCFVIG